jgi:hypothetical protein
MANAASNYLWDLAVRIKAEHEAALTATGNGIEHAMVAGELLLDVKRQLKHGQFLAWLAENRAIPDRTCRLYMLWRRIERRSRANCQDAVPWGRPASALGVNLIVASSEQKLSRFRAGNRAVVCRIKCRERSSTISAGDVGKPHKGDAVMMKESLPCLPGPLYRAVPQRSVGDGRVPRLRARYAGSPDRLSFPTCAVHEGYAPKSDRGS